MCASKDPNLKESILGFKTLKGSFTVTCLVPVPGAEVNSSLSLNKWSLLKEIALEFTTGMYSKNGWTAHICIDIFT